MNILIYPNVRITIIQTHPKIFIQVVECGSMDFEGCSILGEAPGLPDGLDVGGGEGELLEGDVLGQKQLRLRGEHALAECCPVV